MRRQLLPLAVVAVALGAWCAPGIAAASDSGRPGGAITAPEGPTPANGGDQGWGNCGHNSSGGNAHTGDNGNGNGNGGDSQADCTPVPTVTPPPS